jgi:hypothetical protein
MTAGPAMGRRPATTSPAAVATPARPAAGPPETANHTASGSWRPLVDLLVSRAGALTGHRLLLLAVPWLIITTGTLTEAGTVALCHTLPYVIMQGLAGPLLDRVPAARVAAWGDLIGAAAVGLLAVAGSPPLWLLMATMAVVGAADGPASAAKNAVLPDVTLAAGQPPDRGQALAVVAERAASTLGPALAGVLIGLYGTSRTLWLAALLFTAASAFAWRIRRAARPPVTTEPGSYLRQLWAGVRAVSADRPLRAITIMYVVTNALDLLCTIEMILRGWRARAIRCKVCCWRRSNIVSQAMAGNACCGESVGEGGRRVVEEDRDVVVVAQVAGGGNGSEVDRVEFLHVGEFQDQPQGPGMANRLNQNPAKSDRIVCIEGAREGG